MSSNDRLRIVGSLLDDGLFLLKGAVAEVARVLRVSGPTVYRFLKPSRGPAR